MKLCSHLTLVFRELVTCLTYNPCPGRFRRAPNSFRSNWSCPRCENTPENADGAENKYGDGEDNCPEHDSSNDELILKSRLKLDFHFGPRFGEFAPSQPHVGYLASRGRSLVLRQQRSGVRPHEWQVSRADDRHCVCQSQTWPIGDNCVLRAAMR